MPAPFLRAPDRMPDERGDPPSSEGGGVGEPRGSDGGRVLSRRVICSPGVDEFALRVPDSRLERSDVAMSSSRRRRRRRQEAGAEVVEWRDDAGTGTGTRETRR